MQKQVSTIISLKDRFSGPLLQMADNVNKLDRETQHSMNRVNRWSNQVVKGVDKAVKATAKWAKRGVVLGAGWSIKSGLEGASELDYAARKVSSIAGDRMEIAKIRQDIKDFSFELGKSYEEVGEGMYNAISASIPMDLLHEAVELGSKLSIAGFTDMDSSIKLMAATMNAYGMETSEEMQNMADQFLVAQNLGVITVEEMAHYYGRISTLSAQIGASLEEQNAAIATMTRMGMTERESVTGYRSILNAFLKDTTDAQAQALKAMGLGVDFLTAKTFDELGFDGVINAVAEAAEGDLDLVSQIFKDIRGKAAAAIFGPDSGLDYYQDILKEMSDPDDALEDAYSTINDSITRQWEIFKRRIKNLNDELFTEEDGAGGYLVEQLKLANEWLDKNRGGLVEKINDTSESIIESAKSIIEFYNNNKTVIKAIGGTLAGMYVFTKVAGWIESFTRAGKHLLKAINAMLGGEIMFGGKMMTPLAALAAKVSGAIKPIVASVIGGVKAIGGAIGGALAAAAPVIAKVLGIIAVVAAGIWLVIVAMRALNAIVEEGSFKAGWKSIKSDWGSTMDFLGDKVDWVKDKIGMDVKTGGIDDSDFLREAEALNKVKESVSKHPIQAELEKHPDPYNPGRTMADYLKDSYVVSKPQIDTHDFVTDADYLQNKYGRAYTTVKQKPINGVTDINTNDFNIGLINTLGKVDGANKYMKDNPAIYPVTLKMDDFNNDIDKTKDNIDRISNELFKNPIITSVELHTDFFHSGTEVVVDDFNLLEGLFKENTPVGNVLLMKDDFEEKVIEASGEYNDLVNDLSVTDALGTVGLNGYDVFMKQARNVRNMYNGLEKTGSAPQPAIFEPNWATKYIEGKYKGTTSWKGGPVQVHERGGEILDLPNRTRIYPHDESVKMAREDGASSAMTKFGTGGRSISIDLGGVNFSGDFYTEMDLNEIGTKIVSTIKKELNNI